MASDQSGGTPPEVMIDYDNRVQEALRKVVHDVLKDTAETGLPGDHHFYITFKTRAQGVDIPARLAERYPDEMTIVLQHKYWSLTVSDTGFSVGLSFDRQVETLRIPFEAIVGFVDPSVKFALQFQDDDLSEADLEDELDDGSLEDLPESAGIHDGFFKAEHELARMEDDDQSDSASDSTTDPSDDSDTKGGEKTGGDNVVTLDAFRKK